MRSVLTGLLGGGLMLLALNPMSADEKTAEIVIPGPQALRVHQQAILFDGHNDLPWELRSQGVSSLNAVDLQKIHPSMHTDIPRLIEGGVNAQFWSVYVPADTMDTGDALLQTLQQIELVQAMVRKYPQTFAMADTADDVEQIISTGRIASMMGVEGGHCIENEISNIARLHSLGCRYMTLTHSRSLDWADSATDEQPLGGLSEFGEQVIHEMNRTGLLVDLSHVSPATMKHALRITKAPVIFSHSSARAICDHPRNVPDDVLPLVRENGGVIMVNFFSAFIVPTEQLRSDPQKRGTIHDVVDHIDYLAQKTGVDHVGIGSDYDGVPRLPEQLESVATYPRITHLLLQRGYSPEDIHKILGGNVLRALRTAEQIAASMQQEQ